MTAVLFFSFGGEQTIKDRLNEGPTQDGESAKSECGVSELSVRQPLSLVTTAQHCLDPHLPSINLLFFLSA